LCWAHCASSHLLGVELGLEVCIGIRPWTCYWFSSSWLGQVESISLCLCTSGIVVSFGLLDFFGSFGLLHQAGRGVCFLAFDVVFGVILSVCKIGYCLWHFLAGI
jgi:hypothetical protein